MSRRDTVRFWITAGVGWAAIAWGLLNVFRHSLDTRPANLARFVVGGALLHDLLIAPVVVLVGVLVARAVPARARGPVQAALAVTAIVSLFAWPLVRAYGLAANNPTSLPHNYGRNLLVVLALVWLTAGAAVLLKYRD